MYFKRKYQREKKPNKILGQKFFPVFLLIFVLMTYGFSNSYDSSWNYNWDNIRKEIKDSVLKIKHYGSYSFGSGGNGRIERHQLNRQRWIKKNATDSELL